MKAFALLLAGSALLLTGCGTYTTATRAVDWNALEAQSRHTLPLELAPEYEPANLRIPLLSVSTTMSGNVTFGTQPTRIAPLGVSLGNGLAIDSQGAVFLDVLTLLPFDLGGSFSLTVRSNDMFNNTTVLSRRDGMLHLGSPLLGKGTVEVDAQGLVLKSESGAERVRITTGADSVLYKSSVFLDPSYQLTASSGSIEVQAAGLFGHKAVIARDGDAVQFNTTQDPTMPMYEVRKSGDTYLIEYRRPPVSALYKLYMDGREIYFVLRGNILTTVQIDDSTIRVNGRVVASWTTG